MPYLINLIFGLLLTFYVGQQQVTVKIDDDKKVQIKVKKDEKRLNKILSHSSNKYGNKDDGHIEDFL